jgi:excisionase family DNA binding protein
MIRDQVYTLTEAAEVLGVNRVTIRRWIAAGKLEAETIGGVVLISRKVIDHLKTGGARWYVPK